MVYSNPRAIQVAADNGEIRFLRQGSSVLFTVRRNNVARAAGLAPIPADWTCAYPYLYRVEHTHAPGDRIGRTRHARVSRRNAAVPLPSAGTVHHKMCC